LLIAALALLVPFVEAAAQQAVSTIASPRRAAPALTMIGVDANGVSLAQQVPAIETSRLRQQTNPSPAFGVDENGNAVGDVESSSSDDDSLGAQMILKNEERSPVFVVSGTASVVYTSNVALSSADERHDVFAIAGAGIAWTPKLSPTVHAAVAANASMFRYSRTSELDFENFSLHAGLGWSPPSLKGITLFASYDFTELLSAEGRHILADNVFTVGAQKAIPFGRAHGLVLATTGSVGISDPSSAQRSQLGASLLYRLQISRKAETEFLFRPAVHFYNDSGRVDFNQILSWNLRYRFTDWAEVNAFVSYGLNRSDRSAFDYDVVTTGAGAGVLIKF
jgi:hypothetical protein